MTKYLNYFRPKVCRLLTGRQLRAVLWRRSRRETVIYYCEHMPLSSAHISTLAALSTSFIIFRDIVLMCLSLNYFLTNGFKCRYTIDFLTFFLWIKKLMRNMRNNEKWPTLITNTLLILSSSSNILSIYMYIYLYVMDVYICDCNITSYEKSLI